MKVTSEMACNDRVHLKLDTAACRSVDQYLEYTRIVGDDDGGKLFTPSEYEAYKKKVIPLRTNNRLYVSWASTKNGIECKMIGPETKCFCQHRYKQHKTDFETVPSIRPLHLPCRISRCGCVSFQYVPTNGSQSIRCTCKHVSSDHSVKVPCSCKKAGCSCKAFHSAFSCGCGSPAYDHRMIVETKAEREARGKPIGQPVPYQAMGGLTGFSSLADGFARLDSSGIGVPPEHFLQQSPGLYDHPMLKANMPSDSKKLTSAEIETAGKVLTREEQDMAYFEKRYQQRLKQEREASRNRHNPKIMK